jgi:hypothetical protein
MGQEVKVDTVVTDLVTTDTVKADTYVELRASFIRASKTSINNSICSQLAIEMI